MDSEFKYDVFLSYSSKEKEVVHALAERLKQDGLRVWLHIRRQDSPDECDRLSAGAWNGHKANRLPGRALHDAQCGKAQRRAATQPRVKGLGANAPFAPFARKSMTSYFDFMASEPVPPLPLSWWHC
jgi:hypothetical protein